MLIVISDGWPLLFSIKNSSLQSSSNVREYTRIQEEERVRGRKKTREDMQMSSVHIENVTLDVLAMCIHMF
jgi:hypothetical protein